MQNALRVVPRIDRIDRIDRPGIPEGETSRFVRALEVVPEPRVPCHHEISVEADQTLLGETLLVSHGDTVSWRSHGNHTAFFGGKTPFIEMSYGALAELGTMPAQVTAWAGVFGYSVIIQTASGLVVLERVIKVEDERLTVRGLRAFCRPEDHH